MCSVTEHEQKDVLFVYIIYQHKFFSQLVACFVIGKKFSITRYKMLHYDYG